VPRWPKAQFKECTVTVIKSLLTLSDLLANPSYIQDFLYVPADLPNRNKMIQDDDDDDENNDMQSDMVRILLNLAFLSEEKAQKFSFKKENAVALFKR